MSKKNIIAAVAALTLMLGVSSVALAGQHHNTMNQRGSVTTPYQQLTPEKQQAAETIMKEHYAKVKPLQDQMWAKNTELKALSQNANTKPEAISQLVKELSDLRIKLDAEYTSMRDKLEEATGIQSYGMRNGMQDGICSGMMGGQRGGMGGGMMGGRGNNYNNRGHMGGARL